MRANAVVVASDEEALAAVKAREDGAGRVLGAAVAEIAEVSDDIIGANGRAPAGDQHLVVYFDGGEGPIQAEARLKVA